MARMRPKSDSVLMENPSSGKAMTARTSGVPADHHVAELAWRNQPALRADCVGELLARGCRLGSDLAGGVDRVLLPQGVLDIGHVEAEPRQQVGLEPHAHRVVRGTE